jgi:hypothetical protein
MKTQNVKKITKTKFGTHKIKKLSITQSHFSASLSFFKVDLGLREGGVRLPEVGGGV